MKSPELQQLTASEPLTLEQEYDMQRSWREDDDKCTFVILDKQRWDDSSLNEEQCMVGDVNIFLTDPADPSVAELEIMVAGDMFVNSLSPRRSLLTTFMMHLVFFTEPGYRGKGVGKEVTRMMMSYGVSRLGIKKFQAKIGLDNHVSIAMFKKLHFQEVSVCQVFREVTLEMAVDESVRTRLLDAAADMTEIDYRQARCGRQGSA
ncbi:alpha/beta-tubulin-N-acetyltransferase 9 isoform X3 [Antennarius striatus]